MARPIPGQFPHHFAVSCSPEWQQVRGCPLAPKSLEGVLSLFLLLSVLPSQSLPGLESNVSESRKWSHPSEPQRQEETSRQVGDFV